MYNENMKNILYVLLLTACIGLSQTNNVVSTEKPSIVVNFTKNESGEVVLKINGHTQPLELQFNGVKVGTIYEQDSTANLTQFGFESALLALDTAGGKSASSNPDTQAPVIPPVMSSPNPPLATPF